MTTQVESKVGFGVLPRANLLPPEIEERKRLRRVQLALGAAGLVTVVVVAGLYVTAHSGVATARQQLDAARQQQVTLQGQLASYANVEATYQEVSARQTMLVEAMSSEIQWSHYLNDLSISLPDNVWLTGVTATENGSAGAPTASSATALVPTGIGSVAFSGAAFTHDDVANFLDSLAKEPGYTFAYLSGDTVAATPSAGTPPVTFNASVVLTNSALSGRFTSTAGN
ncbi:MAG TPA: PilN domain-containing protein [Mycobacteriales bacterium]|nr:PilN domain-containing protein [Mycobacteriales bacterium]